MRSKRILRKSCKNTGATNTGKDFSKRYMNNKPNNRKMQPDTAADGDSSINTKKGFLISLPSRKKKETAEPGSGIVMSKTDAAKGDRGEKGDKRPPKPVVRDGARDGGAKAPRDTRRDNQNNQQNNQNNQKENAKTGEKEKNTERTQSASPRRDKPQKNGKNENARTDRPDRKERPERTGSPKNKERDGKDNRDNRENRDNRDSRDNNRRGKGDRAAQNPQNEKNGQTAPNDRSKNAPKNDNKQNAKNNRGKGKAQNDRKNGNPNENAQNAQSSKQNSGRRDRRTPKMPSLSPLSSDMMAFARDAKSDFGRSQAKKAEREPSLEEKYKNAVPLAEQIAAEEERRLARARKKTLAEVSHKPASETAAETDALPETTGEAVPASCEIVGIRFREAGKIYYFDPDGQTIPYGTPVIVETSRGSEYGYTAIANRVVPGGSVVAPLKKISRIANTADTEKYRANKELEAEAAVIFKKKVAELKLAMNLVFVEYTFDNSKLLFYFTAETRIDFRELVKELASIFRTRIELRQIGVRDEAKMLGGLGVCGRCVCCNSFLGDFAQVSIKMAKEQGLSLNSAKISGACGKLMCCLRYEDKVYSEEAARTPKIGAIVETAEGKGTVTETSPLKGEIKVALENAADTPPKVFHREDVKVVGFRGKNGVEHAEKGEKEAELNAEIVSEMETDIAENILEATSKPDTER